MLCSLQPKIILGKNLSKGEGFVSKNARKRSEGVKRYFANLTPEERAEIIRKRVESQRRNKLRKES